MEKLKQIFSLLEVIKSIEIGICEGRWNTHKTRSWVLNNSLLWNSVTWENGRRDAGREHGRKNWLHEGTPQLPYNPAQITPSSSESQDYLINLISKANKASEYVCVCVYIYASELYVSADREDQKNRWSKNK